LAAFLYTLATLFHLEVLQLVQAFLDKQF